MQHHIDAYEDVVGQLSGHSARICPRNVDPENRAEEYAEQMTAEINCPLYSGLSSRDEVAVNLVGRLSVRMM